MRQAVVLLALFPMLALAQQRERLPIEQLRLYTEVYGLVRQQYVEPVEHEVLVRKSIDGLLGIDPQAEFLDAERFRELQVSPAARGLGGLGLEVTQRDGVTRIVSAIEGAPASRVGIRPDDVLRKLDGVDLEGKRLREVVELMRGKPGTPVTLVLERRGEPAPIELTLTREVVRARPVRSRRIESGVAYVRVSQFTESAPELLAKEIEAAFGDAEPRLLVLDLRQSPGGLLFSSVNAAAMFLARGAVIARMEGRTEDNKRVFRAGEETRRNAPDPTTLLPVRLREVRMAVLVDRGTAAGSEIVAAALREHKRATLFGERTFGRGTVQTIFPMGAGQAVKLTTGQYFSPAGLRFEGVGVQPDVSLPAPIGIVDFGGEADAVLRDAIEQMLR